jgi:hypothetical protein
LLAEVAAETGPFGNHLRYFMQRLSQRPELREALLQILRKQPDADSASLYRLESAGLIVRQGRESHFRNKLYLRYFQERLHG